MEYNVCDFGALSHGTALQTAAFQAALDAARDGGGMSTGLSRGERRGDRVMVTVPSGEYTVAALKIYSGTELHICAGAKIYGSRECEDYEVFEVPEGTELFTDVEMIPSYSGRTESPGYRRAIFSAYGQKNIIISGEGCDASLIDGRDCFDPDGEEHYRGPFGFFFAGCENVIFKDYTVKNTGNFMHQLCGCENVTFCNVRMLAGHDGAHINCCKNVLFERCELSTGDDCIAGLNTRNVTVSDCSLNSACNIFRMGGTDFTVSGCRACGSGIYPHRLSVPHSKNDRTDISAGRHNTLSFISFFASEVFKDDADYGVWRIENCVIENIDTLVSYTAGLKDALQSGAVLLHLRFENTRCTNIARPSAVRGDSEKKLAIELINTGYISGGDVRDARELFAENCENCTFFVE